MSSPLTALSATELSLVTSWIGSTAGVFCVKLEDLRRLLAVQYAQTMRDHLPKELPITSWLMLDRTGQPVLEQQATHGRSSTYLLTVECALCIINRISSVRACQVRNAISAVMLAFVRRCGSAATTVKLIDAVIPTDTQAAKHTDVADIQSDMQAIALVTPVTPVVPATPVSANHSRPAKRQRTTQHATDQDAVCVLLDYMKKQRRWVMFDKADLGVEHNHPMFMHGSDGPLFKPVDCNQCFGIAIPLEDVRQAWTRFVAMDEHTNYRDCFRANQTAALNGLHNGLQLSNYIVRSVSCQPHGVLNLFGLLFCSTCLCSDPQLVVAGEPKPVNVKFVYGIRCSSSKDTDSQILAEVCAAERQVQRDKRDAEIRCREAYQPIPIVIPKPAKVRQRKPKADKAINRAFN